MKKELLRMLKKSYIIAALFTGAVLLTGCSKEESLDLKDQVQNSTKTEDSESVHIEDAKTEDSESVSFNEVEAEQHTDESILEEATQSDTSVSVNTIDAFYGIWCQASKDENELKSMAYHYEMSGFDTYICMTTDWSNLNQERWYAITAGKYATQEQAQSALAEVQQIYPEAYVKYSGTYQGTVIEMFVEDGNYAAFVSELSEYGTITYRPGYFIGEVPKAREYICQVNYSPNLEIYILDPESEYGPEAESVLVSRDAFEEKIDTAVDWNGIGFICSITVEHGSVVKMEEIYLP